MKNNRYAKNSIRKIEYYGNNKVILADRGTFFGYNMLVNDMRCLPIMGKTGYPVCYDATHSIQMPTSMGNISGGQREFIPHLVRSAVANGINLLLIMVGVQFLLGVLTLIFHVPVWLGVAHQVGAFILLSIMTFTLHKFSK